MAPFKYVFSRPVSSGWKPVPTSSNEPTRPESSIRPVVGVVMRERTLSSVLLPAPLRPITPMTSPFSTSNETSLSAQKVDAFVLSDGAERKRRMGALTRLPSASPKRVYRAALPSRPPPCKAPIRYSLPRFSTRIASSLIGYDESYVWNTYQLMPIRSHHIGKNSFHSSEVVSA